MLASEPGLASAVYELVEQLSPVYVERFIALLRMHNVLADINQIRIMREMNNDAARERLWKFLVDLRRIDGTIAPSNVALGLECALTTAQCEAAKQHVDVVWTGPLVTPVSLRRSAAVLLELIQSAQHEIVIMSYASFVIPDALRALREAHSRGVQMHFILESEDDSAGRLSRDGADAFKPLGGAVGVNFYTWPRIKRPPGALLHAKAVIVDGHSALVTSANMTDNAISANIEIGFLIKGGDAPARIYQHIKGLIAAGEFIS